MIPESQIQINYAEAVQFLYQLRLFGMKLGLENTLRLAAALGDPQQHLRFIHVAGTNGKGSTCAMLESIYRAAGLRVGLFTSPHLVSFCERIQVDRQWISRDDVCRLTEKIQTAIDLMGADSRPTFFEAVTVMALMHFATEKCDMVIWETGMGGRLDATNIVTPLASVITNVQLDHQEWLGDSIAEIAAEKAGIIKPGIPIITTAEPGDALDVITNTADRLNAPLMLVGAPDEKFDLSLSGAHQQTNAALAVGVVFCLAPQIPVSESAINEGLKTTHWEGRMQIIERADGHIIMLDGAHNPAGAEAVAATLLTRFEYQMPTLILGAMRDKDCASMCAILAPLAARIFVTSIPGERGADPQTLADLCRQANTEAPVVICSSIAEALDKTSAEPFVAVTGSLHLVGQAMVELGLAGEMNEAGLNDYVPRQDWSSIRAVTFDVGGTLIEPWPSVGSAYSQIARKHCIDVAAEPLDREFRAAWSAKEKFGYSRKEWSELVKQTFAGLTNHSADDGLFDDLYTHFAASAPWRVFADVAPCLTRLKKRGLKLGIISNWDERLKPLLVALDLEKYFDVIVVSGELGSHKPEAKIFETAAAQLGLPPGAILHVGDSAAEDQRGARGAGFKAVLLRRSGNTPGDAITSLDSVLS